MSRLTVNLAGLTLKNPVIPASGTFGFGNDFARIFNIDILGGIALKGTTLQPRFGNETPRIAECTQGMLNSVGLQNPGAAQVAQEEIPRLRKKFSGAVIANICGFSVQEYVQVAQLLDPLADIIEVNVSCPNVSHGGASFGITPQGAAQVTAAVKAVCKKPVFVKLTPNVTDLVSIARACEEAGADGLVLINTLLGMRINLNQRKPILANTYGGFSGPAVFPVALRAVHQVAGAVKLPLIGVGGISCARDVLEMMMAGATAVQVGSANLVNQTVCKQIIEQLPQMMDRYRIENLTDIIGGAV